MDYKEMKNKILIDKDCFELFKKIITDRANDFRVNANDFRFPYTSVEFMLECVERGNYETLVQCDY